MDYKQRIGMGPGGLMTGNTGGPLMQNQTASAAFGTNFGVNGSATGPALVLVTLVALLVADYVWTRGQQGGR
jgi:hypothetical protein